MVKIKKPVVTDADTDPAAASPVAPNVIRKFSLTASPGLQKLYTPGPGKVISVAEHGGILSAFVIVATDQIPVNTLVEVIHTDMPFENGDGFVGTVGEHHVFARGYEKL